METSAAGFNTEKLCRGNAKMASEVLYRKYRPKKWGDVVGQRAPVKALQAALDGGRAQTFLLQGPSGVGKTTLARIAARHLGCHGMGVVEVAAAVFTGVDSMRELQLS